MKIRIVLVKVFMKQGSFSFIFSTKIITKLSSGSSNPVELNPCFLSDRRVYLPFTTLLRRTRNIQIVIY